MKFLKNFSNKHILIFSIFPQLISQYEINHKESFINYLDKKEYKIEKIENKIIDKNGKDIVNADFDTLERLIELINRG
jgi:hypothetical protein